MEANFIEDSSYQSEEWTSKIVQSENTPLGHKSEMFQNIEEKCVEYVLKNSKPNDLVGAINAIDQFCLEYWMMNLGPIKAQILKVYAQKHKPKKILELGGYVGYSAMVFCSIAPEAKVYTVEISEKFAGLARKIHEHAGVKDRIFIEVGVVQKSENFLKQTGPFDLIFIDHDKKQYLSDFKLLEKFGAVNKGAIVAGDNIIYPGAPDYLEYFKKDVLDQYKSVLYHCYLEYTHIKDALLMSEKL